MELRLSPNYVLSDLTVYPKPIVPNKPVRASLPRNLPPTIAVVANLGRVAEEILEPLRDAVSGDLRIVQGYLSPGMCKVLDITEPKDIFACTGGFRVVVEIPRPTEELHELVRRLDLEVYVITIIGSRITFELDRETEPHPEKITLIDRNTVMAGTAVLSPLFRALLASSTATTTLGTVALAVLSNRWIIATFMVLVFTLLCVRMYLQSKNATNKKARTVLRK